MAFAFTPMLNVITMHPDHFQKQINKLNHNLSSIRIVCIYTGAFMWSSAVDCNLITKDTKKQQQQQQNTFKVVQL